MTRISNVTQALLATALVAAPAAALAQNAVSDQAEEVAAKAEDLQAATNTLNNEVGEEQRVAAEANADGAVRDADGDRDRDDDDDGGEWGWLGLLGLAGLLGLRRRDDHLHHEDRRDHRNSGTTTRPAAGTRGGIDKDTTTRL